MSSVSTTQELLIPCGLNQDTHNEDVGGAAWSSSRHDAIVVLSHLQLAKAYIPYLGCTGTRTYMLATGSKCIAVAIEKARVATTGESQGSH